MDPRPGVQFIAASDSISVNIPARNHLKHIPDVLLEEKRQDCKDARSYTICGYAESFFRGRPNMGSSIQR